ncbi:8258_t:CDS:1, partial [Racocetra fulgida]
MFDIRESSVLYSLNASRILTRRSQVMTQTGHDIGNVCGTTGDTDEDNEEGGNIVVARLTTSCEGKIKDDASEGAAAKEGTEEAAADEGSEKTIADESAEEAAADENAEELAGEGTKETADVGTE